MLEMASLILFGALVFGFLYIIPTIVENISSEEFKYLYLKHLGSKYINSYGK